MKYVSVFHSLFVQLVGFTFYPLCLLLFFVLIIALLPRDFYTLLP
jgi:hypothetical protein